jgi:hypothetical protein
MTHLQENFRSISEHDQDELLEFLSNLTQGDLIRICGDQLMDGADTRRVLKAHELFQNAGS